MRAPTWREKALGVFFPSTCYCCGDYVAWGAHLCPLCEESLRFYRVRRVKKVSRNGRKFSLHACFYYQEAAKEAVHRFKFANRVRPAKFMGEAVADRVRASHTVRPDIVTYIPMAYGDHVLRGYNTAQKIAEYVGKQLGVPVRPLLRKTLTIRAQHRLSAADRKHNVVDAYAAKGRVAGRRILLVDDVVTTGSTMAECAGVLLDAGAQAVWLFAFAAAGGKPRVDREENKEYNETPSLEERTDGYVFGHRD